MIATLCFGGFFGAFLREGADGADGFAERIAPVLWTLLAARPEEADARRVRTAD
jgi:hypothetical protein